MDLSILPSVYKYFHRMSGSKLREAPQVSTNLTFGEAFKIPVAQPRKMLLDKRLISFRAGTLKGFNGRLHE